MTVIVGPDARSAALPTSGDAQSQHCSSPATPARKLDIIVPIYRNAEWVRTCVESLLANLEEIREREPRLWLINDSPGDEPVEQVLALLATRDHVRIIRNPHNVGFVGSVNVGLAAAKEARRDVLLVNSDTVTFPGTLRNLLDAASADPQIGFACPRSNNASICSLPHDGGEKVVPPEVARRRWASVSATMPAWHFAPTAVGFYMYIAFPVLANHGGLLEDFGVGYEEENDLVMRAGKQGHRAILVNNAFAYHAGSASFSLTDIELHQHRHDNHQRLIGKHPEFLPLVRRYEKSPQFRAERLMAGLLTRDESARPRLALDLADLGLHHNGTYRHAVEVVRRLAANWHREFEITGIGTAEAFRFHGLDAVEHLQRADPWAPGLHAVAVRIGQPFHTRHIELLESCAPINVYAMLDTISEDCGPLSATEDFHELWVHVAQHANGLLFNSRFAERQFLTRFPDAASLPRMAKLLSTRLSEYREDLSPNPSAAPGEHVLLLGNHFPHKGVEPALAVLTAAFPTLRFVALAGSSGVEGNVVRHRSGEVPPETMAQLFATARAVVLPSHVEGFGFGLMQALAAGRPVVARRIPTTDEILQQFDSVSGVVLFDTDQDLPLALRKALAQAGSSADDSHAIGWDAWVDGTVRLCNELLARPDTFSRLSTRLASSSLLTRARAAAIPLAAGPAEEGMPTVRAASARTLPLEELIALDGHQFVEHAYATILKRPADGAGLAHYVSELASGTSKIEILHVLRSSAEGQKQAVDISGLPSPPPRRRLSWRGMWARVRGLNR